MAKEKEKRYFFDEKKIFREYKSINAFCKDKGINQSIMSNNYQKFGITLLFAIRNEMVPYLTTESKQELTKDTTELMESVAEQLFGKVNVKGE